MKHHHETSVELTLTVITPLATAFQDIQDSAEHLVEVIFSRLGSLRNCLRSGLNFDILLQKRKLSCLIILVISPVSSLRKTPPERLLLKAC
jgi:hypothetical protein